jgi:hypothetical protein
VKQKLKRGKYKKHWTKRPKNTTPDGELVRAGYVSVVVCGGEMKITA